MSVSTHLAIDIEEYDARIRTFIPDYGEMLQVAGRVAAKVRPRTVVDLGVGTGALSAEVLARAPRTRIVGIDEDGGMLTMAQRRLPAGRSSFLHHNFLTVPLPGCDAIIASFALHHISTPRVKRALYARAQKALRPGGVIVSADCHPPGLEAFAADGQRAWRDHLALSYGTARAAALLRQWAHEDFYTPLDVELQLLQSVGFKVDVAWRRGAFAVVVGQRRKGVRRANAAR